jgi:alpha-galactosidase
MGAHVSAVPNHQTGRLCPINFRAMTAFFGCLGYELDPAIFTDEEKKAVKRQIAFYKAHRTTFQYGRFYRLVSPVPGRNGADGRVAAWMVISPDEKEAIVGVYKILAKPAKPPLMLKLAGLNASADYDVSLWEEGGFTDEDKEFNCGRRGGDELMQSGLLLDGTLRHSPHKGDFFSELFVVERADGV